MILRRLQRAAFKRPFWPIYGGDRSLYMGRWWLLGGSALCRDNGEDEVRRSRLRLTWAKGRSRLDAMIGKVVAVRLHHIAREDRARDLHVHPCGFVSIVVSGWYRERLPLVQWQDPAFDGDQFREIVRRPWSVAYRRADDRHTITEVSPGGAWTIFIMGPKTGRGWGFWTRAGFVKASDYGTMP